MPLSTNARTELWVRLGMLKATDIMTFLKRCFGAQNNHCRGIAVNVNPLRITTEFVVRGTIGVQMQPWLFDGRFRFTFATQPVWWQKEQKRIKRKLYVILKINKMRWKFVSSFHQSTGTNNQTFLLLFWHTGRFKLLEKPSSHLCSKTRRNK